MNERLPTEENRLLRVAIVLTIAGLVLAGLFLIVGFSPVSLGYGMFLGVPLLLVGMVLYLIVVIRDFRRHGVL